jgi:elongation factor P
MTHRTPGNLRGFVQAKMRSLRSGTMIEHRFSSEDKVEKARLLEEQEMEYLYDDGEYYYFMNTENYEQMHLMKDLLGDAVLPDSAAQSGWNSTKASPSAWNCRLRWT